MAEYDEDYNGEDLEMSGVNIERGKFISYNQSTLFPSRCESLWQLQIEIGTSNLKNSDSGVFTIRGSLRGARSARQSQVKVLSFRFHYVT